MYHRQLLDGRFVSAPLPRLSPYTLAGVAILLVGGVSSSLQGEARKPPANFASPKYMCVGVGNKNFGNLILLRFSFYA
jgi:hypothetical protein